MDQTCRGCGGKHLLRSERVVARADCALPVVLSGLAETGMSASVCVDCGHIDLTAAELTALRKTFAAHDPLDLSR